jgi:hypothetical protein
MKYAVEMDSGAIIYIPGFIKTRSGIKADGWEVIHRHTERMVIT